MAVHRYAKALMIVPGFRLLRIGIKLIISFFEPDLTFLCSSRCHASKAVFHRIGWQFTCLPRFFGEFGKGGTLSLSKGTLLLSMPYAAFTIVAGGGTRVKNCALQIKGVLTPVLPLYKLIGRIEVCDTLFVTIPKQLFAARVSNLSFIIFLLVIVAFNRQVAH